jgi:hypothetical protein
MSTESYAERTPDRGAIQAQSAPNRIGKNPDFTNRRAPPAQISACKIFCLFVSGFTRPPPVHSLCTMQTLALRTRPELLQSRGQHHYTNRPPLTDRASQNPFKFITALLKKLYLTAALICIKKWPAKDPYSSVSMQPQKVTAHDNCTIPERNQVKIDRCPANRPTHKVL